MAINGIERTLYLHVGTGKAGTSSIQDRLRQIKDPTLRVLPLKAFGVGNATRLAAACGGVNAHQFFVIGRKLMTEKSFVANAATIWESARLEIAGTPAPSFVASSEFIGALVRRENISLLKKNLTPLFDRVEIIIYLREKLGFLRSLWAQSVKGPAKSAETFDEFLKGIEKRRHFWDYEALLKDWSSVFAEEAIKVTVFDPAALRGGDVVCDFFHKIGLSEVCSKNQGDRKNVSPDGGELERIRRENLMRKNPGLRSMADPPSLGPAMSPEEYKDFVLKYVSDSNRWVNSAFLSGRVVQLSVA